MSLDTNQAELAFGLQAVRRASVLVRHIQTAMIGGTGTSFTKDDKSPVTVADFAAQAVVAHLLKQSFPDDLLVGEENADALRAPEAADTLEMIAGFVRREISEAAVDTVCDWIDCGGGNPSRRFWTLDPIDGTKGFLRRQQYAVALALIENGEVQLGVLGCPNLVGAGQEEIGGPGSLVAAVRGQGAWTRPLESEGSFTRIAVSPIADPAKARLLRSVESGHTNMDRIGDLARKMRVRAEPVLMDSQAKYAVLAAGGGDALFRLLNPKQPDYKERIWDQAAGSIIVEEAGGRITDLSGKPLDFNQGRTLAANAGVLATNGHLHEATLAALRATD